MPKILINEKDRTSPGTPGGYSNYSVLLVGFADSTKEKSVDAKKPDSNGVYEFSSAQSFKDTIGLMEPRQTAASTGTTIYHYGNQMAYELLNMGYSIIYKPISDVSEIANETFWEIFKDKASYDFRFITHGLLESSDIIDTDAYHAKSTRLSEVEDAIAALDKIDADIKIEMETNPDLEEAKAKEEAYDEIKNDYMGFRSAIIGTGAYPTYADARTGTDVEKIDLNNQLITLRGALPESLINQVNGHIANLAKYKATGALDTNSDPTNDMYMKEIPGRGDCIALIEVDEKRYLNNTATAKPEELIINAINEMSAINGANGKYCAMTVPSVYYNMTPDIAFKDNKKFPGAFHYLACFANSLNLGFAEWYAAAGYTRGVSSYVIDYTSVKLGEIAINALEPRNFDDYSQEAYPKFACNVIANFRGSYYLWGNRTAHPLGKKGNLATGDLVASSFLNIRHLCTTIKKQLYVACRTFTFDPNSDTLWVNFCNAIRPTLEAMKADQGIRDYKILKVYEEKPKKATLKAKIRIIPIEAVEDFDLEVSLEDSFGETAAVVTE